MRSYMIELWPIGSDRPTDCLPETFATIRAAKRAAKATLQAAKAARDAFKAEPWDCFDRFTIVGFTD